MRCQHNVRLSVRPLVRPSVIMFVCPCGANIMFVCPSVNVRLSVRCQCSSVRPSVSPLESVSPSVRCQCSSVRPSMFVCPCGANVRLSVRPSVRPSVRAMPMFVCPSVRCQHNVRLSVRPLESVSPTELGLVNLLIKLLFQV